MSQEMRVLLAVALAFLVGVAGCGAHSTTTIAANEGGITHASSSVHGGAGQVQFTSVGKGARHESKGEDCAIEVRLACKEEPRWIRSGLGKIVDRQDFELEVGLSYLGEMAIYRCGMPQSGDYYPAQAEELAKREACKQGADMIVYAGCKCALAESQDDKIGGFQAYSPGSPPVYVWRVYNVEK